MIPYMVAESPSRNVAAARHKTVVPHAATTRCSGRSKFHKAVPVRLGSLWKKDAGPELLPRRTATTIAEVLVSLILVSGLLIVALDLLSASAKGQQHMADRAKAQNLAYDLISEIMRQAYEDPDTTPVFGREGDETGSDRSVYDDVDDYDGWSALPPQYKDGTEMTELTDWRRAVTVDWVRNNSLNTVQGYGSGTVRIIVRVEVGGVQLASLMAVKTGAASIRTLDVRESLPSKDPIIIDPLPLD